MTHDALWFDEVVKFDPISNQNCKYDISQERGKEEQKCIGGNFANYVYIRYTTLTDSYVFCMRHYEFVKFPHLRKFMAIFIIYTQKFLFNIFDFFLKQI